MIPTLGFAEACRQASGRLFDFRGRSRRSEFWWASLALFLVSAGLSLLQMLLDAVAVMVVVFLCSIVLNIMGLALSFRRLHDTGRSGWWMGGYMLAYLLGLVVLSIVMICSGFDSAAGYKGGELSCVSGLLMAFFSWFALSLIYGLVMLYFLCQDSEQGENKFGASPKYVEEAEPVATAAADAQL
ncbi:MAG: DUF805 domain-containing protein [Prevotella sp.]